MSVKTKKNAARSEKFTPKGAKADDYPYKYYVVLWDASDKYNRGGGWILFSSLDRDETARAWQKILEDPPCDICVARVECMVRDMPICQVQPLLTIEKLWMKPANI